MLPLALLLFIGLLALKARLLSLQWALRLSLGIGITLATKLAFFGWGLGIAYFDFTGVSGHTLLATAVLPVLLGWLFAEQGNDTKNVGISFGLIVAALVGWSRVKVGAHSYSEVIVGWVLGYVIVQPLYRLGVEHQLVRWGRVVPVALTLLIATQWYQPSHALHLPSHEWEQHLAKWVTGHEHIYKRHDLHLNEKQLT